MCGGSNLSTVLLLWGIYIKKCISSVRIRLQTQLLRPYIRLPRKFPRPSPCKRACRSPGGEPEPTPLRGSDESGSHPSQQKRHADGVPFLLCRVSDLDAKPCVADLDAREFCRGYTNPLAMMGVALDRYLPGHNAMLVNEILCIYNITFFNIFIDQLLGIFPYFFRAKA